ncbi:nuclear transport factor 2 family protein [Hymenobacter terrenus]|uniref:nuclear transport factor 2 family protein n=1 Tax=Hymenobacter terrenus TaxID=1629124 RepID=UPI000697CB64|nr:nuclear transport factor 2 family protein [Hymenobacter terrenus]
MSNEEIVQAIYAAVAANDLERVLAFLAPEVVAYQADSLSYGGRYDGHEGFRRMGAAIFNTWQDFKSVPSDFVAAGVYVVVFATMTATSRTTGQPWQMPLAECWQLRDGLVTEIRPFYWDTQATIDLL